MTDITDIPLDKLTTWKGNVRKTQSKTAIDELAASIRVHGLQQNLVVRKDGKTFAVIAGGRRLKALQQLAKAGDIEATYPVPCRIAEAGDAAEISLVENVIREDMHPPTSSRRSAIVNQLVAVKLLTRRGHTVTVVNSGREALAALERDTFDVVLMDGQMPEMSGFEATAAIRLREQESGTHQRIVAMTANAMAGDRERYIAAGMDDYLSKPIDPRLLFALVEEPDSRTVAAVNEEASV